jgi:hypothetical protein
MSNYDDAISRAWGTEFDREWNLKQHIRHQDEEATRTREAIEKASEQAAWQAQQQAAMLEDMAALQQREANLKRLIPDMLFRLSQQRSNMQAVCQQLANPSNDGMSSDQIIQAHESVRTFGQLLFQLDPSYLSDFSQKQLLDEMRTELRQLVNQVNTTASTETRIKFLEGTLIARFSPLNAFTPQKLNAYFTGIRRRTEMEAKYNSLEAASNSLYMVLAIGVGGIGFLGCGLLAAITDAEVESPLFIIGVGSLVLFFPLWGLLHVAFQPAMKQLQREYAALTAELENIHPLEGADALRALRDGAEWDGGWAVKETTVSIAQRELNTMWHIALAE